VEEKMQKFMTVLLVSAAFATPLPFQAFAQDIGVSVGGISAGVDVNTSNGLGVGADVSAGGSNGVNASADANVGGGSVAGADVNASVGGSNGVNAGANANVGGGNGIDAGATASIGGSGGVNANVGVGAGGGRGVGVDANIGIGGGTTGTNPGTPGTGTNPSNLPGSLTPGQMQTLRNMSQDERRQLMVRCATINAASYDAALVNLCRLLRQTAAR
jgi:hypothetical protein